VSHVHTENRPELSLRRVFSSPDISPYDQVKWERRDATLTNSKGEVIFEQKDVEVPEAWSQTATNIVVSKYFYGKLGTPERETSVRQLVYRVVKTIADSGAAQGYFELESDEHRTFFDELTAVLLQQRAAFNSPVWFNVGLHQYEPQARAEHWFWNEAVDGSGECGVTSAETGYRTPQCSACFINSVGDSMDGIMSLARTEVMLFKFGSGTGTNFSTLRSSKETVSGGGLASGPLSFMRGLDAFAGVIKSGGKTRRAAKMAILNVGHPDIAEFIDCKRIEDQKARALMVQGYDGTSGPDSEAYSSVFYQNANNSVRVSDEFMEKAGQGEAWALTAVKDGHVVEHVNAAVLLRKIAEATWACGDPGMQFDTTINAWHTCPNSGRQNATNPCSEFSFLDDSSCNLASINLLKFLRKNNTFDVDGFRHTVHVMILAQDILVDLSGYPTKKIAQNSHDFRPLGLGYANLGALLMALGLAYDSDAGRAYAACVTSLMTGEAYLMSAQIAGAMLPLHAASEDLDTYGATGACPGWFPNQEAFLGVIFKHGEMTVMRLADTPKEVPADLRTAAEEIWTRAYKLGQQHGYRNAQVTVLAPTGTIGFLMDCDTTGIEPELGLIKFKRLVGGGLMKIVNDTVSRALGKLGYKGNLADAILKHIDETGTVEGSDLGDGHLAVFDTAFKPAQGTRSIHYTGHIRMMGAVQPFLSGAISKTVNLPEEATVEDVEQAYVEGWKLGLKAIAVYRDGSKKNQVLVTKRESQVTAATPAVPEDLGAPPKATRHRLPDERPAINHKFNVGGHDGYLNVGLYKNGQPGEVFITMAKGGSTINGVMDGFAVVVSIALQHGVPLETIVSKLAHTRFEPSGWSKYPDMGYAKSILDYFARYMEKRFVRGEQMAFFEAALGNGKGNGNGHHPAVAALEAVADEGLANTSAEAMSSVLEFGDSPICATCGAITVRNGSCYKCLECGSTTGCS
jgi:ribonucleoside-diphosphate reductase alpha chain